MHFFRKNCSRCIDRKSFLFFISLKTHSLFSIQGCRSYFFYYENSLNPSITDGVHRNENYVEIIPVFSTFSNFFKKKKIIKAILCNFSMRLLKLFHNLKKKFFALKKLKKTTLKSCSEKLKSTLFLAASSAQTAQTEELMFKKFGL